MKGSTLNYDSLPRLDRPLLIAAFAGWGNALSVATDMAAYLVTALKAKKFAHIDPDMFYRYDETRPQVSILQGRLTGFSMPGGSLFAARTGMDQRDVVIFKGEEPSLSWNLFVQTLFSLCQKLKVDTIITLGSMFDQIRHTERVISGIASTDKLHDLLAKNSVAPISYQGPSAIHSIIQAQGPQNGYGCMSLWCHCPFYVQCAQHFGYLSKLGELLSSLGGFELNLDHLNRSWTKLKEQIADLIAGNPELQNMIKKMKETGSSVPGPAMGKTPEKGGKVVDLRGFLPSRKNGDGT